MAFIKEKDFKSANDKLEILLMKECFLKSFKLLRTFIEFKMYDRIKGIR